MNEKPLAGRIAFRVEGDWWVAYYALPDTMEGSLELARVQMAIVANHPQRKHAFMKLVQSFIADTTGAEFNDVVARLAPEHERAGRG